MERRVADLKNRPRSNSLPSVADFFKRKREGEEQDKTEEAEAFKKSKIVVRSPEKTKLETTENKSEAIEMDQQILEQLKKLDKLDKLEKQGEDLKTQLNDIKKEIKEDIAELKEDWRKDKEEMQKEINELRDRLEKVEEREAKQDRQERKRNIIIAGMNFDSNSEKKLVEQIQTWCKKILEVEIKVETAFKISKEKHIFLARLATMEEKINIMKNKNKLRRIKEIVYISDDLNAEDREIQKKIREIAKEEEGKGKQVKIGYRKLQVDGRWIDWTDLKEK